MSSSMRFLKRSMRRSRYYEVLTLDEVLDPQTILAYEMNWNPLPIPHGAPCRLRIEIKTGYKMVKYLRAIEVVETFANDRGRAWRLQGRSSVL